VAERQKPRSNCRRKRGTDYSGNHHDGIDVTSCGSPHDAYWDLACAGVQAVATDVCVHLSLARPVGQPTQGASLEWVRAQSWPRRRRQFSRALLRMENAGSSPRRNAYQRLKELAISMAGTGRAACIGRHNALSASKILAPRRCQGRSNGRLDPDNIMNRQDCYPKPSGVTGSAQSSKWSCPRQEPMPPAWIYCNLKRRVPSFSLGRTVLSLAPGFLVLRKLLKSLRPILAEHRIS